MSMLMLIINPGSTSTKTAFFDGDKELSEEVIRHDGAELAKLLPFAPWKVALMK